MQSHNPPVKISENDIAQYRDQTGTLLSSVSNRVTSVSENVSHAGVTSQSARVEKSLFGIAKRISNDEFMIDDNINHVLHTVRVGMQIALHLSLTYENFSGLTALKKQNVRNRGFDNDALRAEFHTKNQTAGYIFRFVSAYYVLHVLSSQCTDSGITVAKPEVPNIDPTTLRSTAQTLVFYYADALENNSVVSPETFAKMTCEYFQVILDDMVALANAGSIKMAEAFTAQTYLYEPTNFLVNGFEVGQHEHTSKHEFKRLTFDKIVGNSEAKHEANRMIDRLTSYDPVTERNPFRELTGTFQAIRLGYGLPGTGKGLQIMATATALDERCEMIGIPFIYHPLFASVISSYQGKSGAQMEDWFRVLNNPKVIIYAPIDDAEQVLQDRTMQGVSAGVREAVSGYLVGTEGAGAVWTARCNVVSETFTNLADQLDPAVLSRHQSRFPINGAQRWEDFCDQGHLWWHPIADSLPDLFDLGMPKEYALMSLQQAAASMSAILDHYDRPKNANMNAIYEQTTRECDERTVEFFARLSANVQKQYPNFTSREERNIQAAVSARLVDFDFPESWRTDPEEYFRKSYDEKLAMLKVLQRESMKGLKMSDMWRQEVCRYLDAFADIQDMRFEREVKAEVERRRVITEAVKRFEAEQ